MQKGWLSYGYTYKDLVYSQHAVTPGEKDCLNDPYAYRGKLYSYVGSIAIL